MSVPDKLLVVIVVSIAKYNIHTSINVLLPTNYKLVAFLTRKLSIEFMGNSWWYIFFPNIDTSQVKLESRNPTYGFQVPIYMWRKLTWFIAEAQFIAKIRGFFRASMNLAQPT